MNNLEFVEKLKKIANEYNTVYGLGMIGQPINSNTVYNYPCNQLSWWTTANKNMIKNLVGKNYFGFDCVCLVKSVLWGWNGETSKIYGGATYTSNGVPDINADQMIKKCSNASTDFKNVQVGEFLWMSGHCGVYIGNGLAVECTPIWKNGVQITAVGNMGSKAGYNTRTWTKHGKLPYITYVAQKSIEEVAKEVIDGKWDNYPKRKELLEAAGYNYKEVQAKVEELLKANTIKYYPKTAYKGGSLVDGLNSIGVNSSFLNRAKIAKKNGIGIYLGTATQNTKLLNLLKQGKLIKI